MDPLELRFVVYRHIVQTGAAPSRHTLADIVGNLDTVDGLLSELHDRHMLVLDDRPDRRGEIRMALPFATRPTNFRVTADDGSWLANCAWDALATLAAPHTAGHTASTWPAPGEPLPLDVTAGRLDNSDGYIHFALPASRWWDDIVLT